MRLWRLYSLQGQGIAVRTTFKRLREALDKEPKEICAGRVKYIDYGWHSIEMLDGMYVVFHKRESFAHEQEVRLAYQIPEGVIRCPHPEAGVKEVGVADAPSAKFLSVSQGYVALMGPVPLSLPGALAMPIITKMPDGTPRE
jgi:hypothetical protein